MWHQKVYGAEVEDETELTLEQRFRQAEAMVQEPEKNMTPYRFLTVVCIAAAFTLVMLLLYN